MDVKMRGNIVTGLMALCLILGLWGQFGSTWLTADDDAIGDGFDAEYVSLSDTYVEFDISDSGMDCSDVKEEAEDENTFGKDSELSCDGNTLIVSLNLSDLCDTTEDDDDCDLASAGFTGGLILWFASGLALICVVMLIIKIIGIEIDEVLNKASMIMIWTTGVLTLLAVSLWYIMLPDVGEFEFGINTWTTIVGGIFALVAGGMDTFMADE